MLKWSKECLSFSYDEESGVVYRLLDFLGAVGYRVGTDGSVWSRWRRMPQRGSGKGPGSISVLSDSWECFTNRRTGYRQVQLSLESGEIGRFLVHRPQGGRPVLVAVLMMTPFTLICLGKWLDRR